MIDITAKIQKLSEQKLLRSQEVVKEYSQVTKLKRELFISKVQGQILENNFYLAKNDFPYDLFCRRQKLDHYVLFVNKNFFSSWSWVKLLQNLYPDFEFYSINCEANQSVKEIQHIHLFKYDNTN